MSGHLENECPLKEFVIDDKLIQKKLSFADFNTSVPYYYVVYYKSMIQPGNFQNIASLVPQYGKIFSTKLYVNNTLSLSTKTRDYCFFYLSCDAFVIQMFNN